jgi:Tol biopolymer transport system component
MTCRSAFSALGYARAGQSSELIASLALLVVLLGCDSPTSPNQPAPAPALESVPYSLLGSGTVAFERIGPDGDYSAVYIIDATASRSHGFDIQLTFGPALSPDGEQLAYTTYTDDQTFYDVYVARIDGTNAQQVTAFALQEGPPSWTRDGTRIVVVGANQLMFNVYSQSVSNPADLAQLTDFQLGAGGSPDCPFLFGGERIAVSTQGSLAFACGSEEIDVLSSTGALLASYVPSHADGGHWHGVFSPTWSPDGTQIAFIETTQVSATDDAVIGVAVKLMDADGSNVTTLVTGPGSNAPADHWAGHNNGSLCWMPDGSRLVFGIAESASEAHLWVVRADGTGLAQLTFAPGVFDRSVSCAR